MRTILAKAPAYGMPTLAGAVNKPEKVNFSALRTEDACELS